MTNKVSIRLVNHIEMALQRTTALSTLTVAQGIAVVDLVAAAVLEERRRCAAVARGYDHDGLFGDDLPKGWEGCRRNIAERILEDPAVY